MDIVAISICAILASLFIFTRVKVGGFWGLITKTIASLAFVAAGLYSVISGVARINIIIFVVLGLICGLIGDILLDLKVMYKQDGKKYFNAGTASFGIGHIFYLVALSIYASPIITSMQIFISILIAIVLGLIIMRAGKFMKLDFKGVYLQILIYTIILTFLTAFSIWLATINTLILPFAIGMVLFWLSDIVLSTMYFGGKENDNVLCVINHALYYAAQILIVAFVLFTF